LSVKPPKKSHAQVMKEIEDSMDNVLEDLGDPKESPDPPEETEDSRISILIDTPGDAAPVPSSAAVSPRPEISAGSDKSADQLKRVTEEYDGFRKRAERRVTEAVQRTKDQMLVQFLQVLDNLDRALGYADASQDGPVAQGVRMVTQQFHDVLGRQDVCRIDTADRLFDPQDHEAVSRVETSEYSPGTIMKEVQSGYRIEDRLLRPAKVVVAVAPSAADGEN